MENLGDVATRVVMLTTQGLLETSMIILMILLCDWRIALVSLAGVAIFLVINTVMQNAGKQTKRLNAANEACVRANVVLGLDTMDIDGKELNPENHDIEVKNIEFSYDKKDNRRNLTHHTGEDNDGDRRTIWRWKDNPVQSDR